MSIDTGQLREKVYFCLPEPRQVFFSDMFCGGELQAEIIDELAILGYSEIKMGPGGEPGRADMADQLSLADPYSARYAFTETAQVTVVGHVIVGMPYLNEVSEPALFPCEYNSAVAYG